LLCELFEGFSCGRSPQTIDKGRVSQTGSTAFQYKELVQKEREGLGEALHVLNSSDEEALLAHILDAEHASSAEAMVLFALRKGSFNCLLAPPVDPFANRRLGENRFDGFRFSLSASVSPCLALLIYFDFISSFSCITKPPT